MLLGSLFLLMRGGGVCSLDASLQNRWTEGR
jgi:hypothetical protein